MAEGGVQHTVLLSRRIAGGGGGGVAVEKGKGASGMQSTIARRGVAEEVLTAGRQADRGSEQDRESKALETSLRSMCSAVPGFYSGGRN